jgi:hypothetical protein
MKLNIKQFLKFFLILYLIHVVFILIFGELDLLPFDLNSERPYDELYVIYCNQGFNFFMRLKYIYIYYFITFLYLTLVHTYLIFLTFNFKNKLKKIIIYVFGMFVLSFIMYYSCNVFVNFHFLDKFWFIFENYIYNVVSYYLYINCLFMIINLIFTKIYFNYFKISKK